MTVSTAKTIREYIGASHVVIFSINEDGSQNVASHGKNRTQAKNAAKLANELKGVLGWPIELCESKPIERVCGNCIYYKRDWGIHCFNGWSGDGSTGFCRYEPNHVKVTKDNFCGHFEPL